MASVTLLDVGRAAGVSRATASLVLRGSSRVSDETAARVRAAMDELGYVYNRQAAAMRESRTMLLAFLATNIVNPFFGEVAMAIDRVVRAAGYTMLTGFTDDDPDLQSQVLRTMTQHRVDGVIVQPAIGTSPDALTGIAACVQYFRQCSDQVDYVGLHNVDAGRQVGEHLARIGVRQVAYLGGVLNSTTRADRMAGLAAGLAAGGVPFDPSIAFTGANVLDGGVAAAQRMLDAGLLPDAIVCHSDATAIGAVTELRRRGLTPGADVAVAGFDDLPLAAAQYPPLTSVGLDEGGFGEHVAQVMLDRIATPDAPVVVERIAPALRIRASTTTWRRR